jgi:hypothetical protein
LPSFPPALIANRIMILGVTCHWHCSKCTLGNYSFFYIAS